MGFWALNNCFSKIASLKIIVLFYKAKGERFIILLIQCAEYTWRKSHIYMAIILYLAIAKINYSVFRLLDRLRAVPIFSYSPSRMEKMEKISTRESRRQGEARQKMDLASSFLRVLIFSLYSRWTIIFKK